MACLIAIRQCRTPAAYAPHAHATLKVAFQRSCKMHGFAGEKDPALPRSSRGQHAAAVTGHLAPERGAQYLHVLRRVAGGRIPQEVRTTVLAAHVLAELDIFHVGLMGTIIDKMGVGQPGTEGGDIMDFYGVCILILVLYGIGLLIGLIQAAANSHARERQKMTPEERTKAERHDEDYYLMMATHEYMTNHHH